MIHGPDVFVAVGRSSGTISARSLPSRLLKSTFAGFTFFPQSSSLLSHNCLPFHYFLFDSRSCFQLFCIFHGLMFIFIVFLRKEQLEFFKLYTTPCEKRSCSPPEGERELFQKITLHTTTFFQEKGNKSQR